MMMSGLYMESELRMCHDVILGPKASVPFAYTLQSTFEGDNLLPLIRIAFWRSPDSCGWRGYGCGRGYALVSEFND